MPPFYLLDYTTLKKIQNNKLSLNSICEKWKNEYKIEPESICAARSSTNVEDSKEKSFAGLFKTEINVLLPNLPNAIENVLKAYSSLNEDNYYHINNLKYRIIIQKMIKEFNENENIPLKLKLFIIVQM